MGSSSEISMGISFKLCTERHVRPSRRALSSSFTNSPFPPTLSSVRSSILSPVVFHSEKLYPCLGICSLNIVFYHFTLQNSQTAFSASMIIVSCIILLSSAILSREASSVSTRSIPSRTRAAFFCDPGRWPSRRSPAHPCMYTPGK